MRWVTADGTRMRVRVCVCVCGNEGVNGDPAQGDG